MRVARIAGILLLTAVAVLALLLPGAFKGRFATFGLLHDLSHVAAFWLAFVLTASGWKNPRHVAFLGLILFSFGIAVELLQVRVYGNRLEYRDISGNALGILLGFVTRSIWTGRRIDREK